MAIFELRDTPAGRGMKFEFGQKTSGVEIVFVPGDRPSNDQRGLSYVISGRGLKPGTAVNEAIDKLITELNALKT